VFRVGVSVHILLRVRAVCVATKVVSGIENLGAGIVLYRQGHLSSSRASPLPAQVTSDRPFSVYTPHGTNTRARAVLIIVVTCNMCGGG